MITVDKRYKYLNKLKLEKLRHGYVRVCDHPAFTIPGQKCMKSQHHSVPIHYEKDELKGFIFHLDERLL